jgi:hypothetical protein
VPHVESEVKNLYEEPVTEPQIFGRSLLKTFTVAASYAKEKYGVRVRKNNFFFVTIVFLERKNSSATCDRTVCPH